MDEYRFYVGAKQAQEYLHYTPRMLMRARKEGSIEAIRMDHWYHYYIDSLQYYKASEHFILTEPKEVQEKSPKESLQDDRVYVNAQEARDYLGCTYRMLEYARTQGYIKTWKEGALYRYALDSLQAYKASGLAQRSSRKKIRAADTYYRKPEQEKCPKKEKEPRPKKEPREKKVRHYVPQSPPPLSALHQSMAAWSAEGKPEWMLVKDIQRAVPISHQAISHLIRKGILPAEKQGRFWRVRSEDLANYWQKKWHR